MSHGCSIPNQLDVCVGRQPIYNRRRDVVAYELLFRRPGAVNADVRDGEQATAQVILNSLMEIGIERLSGGLPVFLNCTRNFLEGDPLIPPEVCVLEVLEDITLDQRLVESLRVLKKRGYRIALDDFVYRPGVEPVIEIADYVKVDLTLLTPAELESHAARLYAYPTVLLAEKIDSEEQLNFCHDLGFELFQGYFLRRPDVLHKRRAPSHAVSTLRLINECEDPNSDVKSISSTISRDPALSYKLLQLVNSCLFDARTSIDTIPRAIQAAGTQLLMRWATVLLMAGFDNCPPAYLAESLRRARMCEIVAESQGCSSPSRAYMAGLLSVLDSMLNQPMAEILESLPLAAELKAALLAHEEPVGRILAEVIAWESERPLRQLSSDESQRLQQAYWESVDYAGRVSQTVRSF